MLVFVLIVVLGGLASIALRLLKEPELRVTAHKQLVRLLKSEPSKEHMDILFKDWENIKNHIDVKFTILESALKLLSIKNEYAVATGKQTLSLLSLSKPPTRSLPASPLTGPWSRLSLKTAFLRCFSVTLGFRFVVGSSPNLCYV